MESRWRMVKGSLALATAGLVLAGLVFSCAARSDDPADATDQADQASTGTAAPSAAVSFTFDDCYASHLTLAAPILHARGFAAAEYAAIRRMTEGPDEWGSRYMTWSELHTLHDQYGWEIASHSVTHPLLTTVDPDKLLHELADSKATLQQNGFDIVGFATPYGDYNDKVLRVAATLYDYHRPFHDTDVLNKYPVDRSLLWVKQVQAGGGGIPSTSVADVKGWIDDAVRDKAWLVLVLHEIREASATELATAVGTDGDVGVAWGYGFSASDLASIADYLVAKHVSVRTPRDVLALPRTTEHFSNGSFVDGLRGFTTDHADRVVRDTVGHGAWPTPAESVALVGAAQGAHLFGPKIAVTPGAPYTLETYVDASMLTHGTVGFYVDEWDAAGKWVSGQYVRDVPEDPRRKVEHVAFAYVAGKAAARASLQLIISPAATGVAYVDGLSWFSGRRVY